MSTASLARTPLLPETEALEQLSDYQQTAEAVLAEKFGVTGAWSHIACSYRAEEEGVPSLKFTFVQTDGTACVITLWTDEAKSFGSYQRLTLEEELQACEKTGSDGARSVTLLVQ